MTQFGQAPLAAIQVIDPIPSTADGLAVQSVEITFSDPMGLEYGVFLSGLTHGVAPAIGVVSEIHVIPTEATTGITQQSYATLGTASVVQQLLSEARLLGVQYMVDVATAQAERQIGVYTPQTKFATFVFHNLSGQTATAGRIALIPLVGDDTV